jgi:hypothetical protein
MKTGITHTFSYALLLILSLTLSSCFLFQKQKHVTKSNTDSTAYEQTQSSITKHQSEAWNKYLDKKDSSYFFLDYGSASGGQSSLDAEGEFTFNPETGLIQAKGNIKSVRYYGVKQTTKKDEGTKQSTEAYKYINKTYTVVKTVYVTKSKTKQPDIKAIFVTLNLIALFLALAVIVVVKWAKIKAKSLGLWGKVINFLKGVFTGI